MERILTEFEIRMKELTGSEYELCSEYTGSQKEVTIMHAVCGREFKTTPYQFLNGQRCPILLDKTDAVLI